MDSFRYNNDLVIFRGQRRYWGLIPSIARKSLGRELPSIEKKLLNEFKEDGESYLQFSPRNNFDWLAIAQHHRLPTRLLDFTRDPYVALWFAACEKGSPDERPEVWVMIPEEKDIIDMSHKSNPFAMKRTKVFETTFRHPRILAQKSVFVSFKYDKRFRCGFVPVEKNATLRKRIQRIRFSRLKSGDVLRLLRKKGYTKQRLFPDLEDLAVWIGRKYIMNS